MVSLTQLGIANQQLNTTVVILHNTRNHSLAQCVQIGSTRYQHKPPPSYEESQLISTVRQRNLRKRASMSAVRIPVLPEAPGNDIESPRDRWPETRSIAQELPAGDLGDPGCDLDFDRLSIQSSLLDMPATPPTSRSAATGKARARRWLELQCRDALGDLQE
jgi:hypothetical protein